ncbi:type II secretion system F family protein [Sphingopyxis alaskensis]|jgi:tight adherence protein B|uniref:Type II secretion system protein n=1 Tax=Sphingopyxis alaskensis (strain DSM 13593 / LMG 18877 / RB2256) TaxID=317655 RepID=Q1GPF5_SPHAL|nr:type II secretion system F family protein [Sphingopyxis alaskensis]ABF54467.1 type II secretion system protein [Sphingopyxis alaskensis RB2256]MCM3417810.1 type II secretion system F family protein [Sphingopyxis alaskensis]
MNDAAIRFLMMLALFALVVLLAQAVIGFVVERSGKSRAVNRRLRLIESGVDREAVTSLLRKSLPRRLEGVPPWAASTLQSFRRLLNAANIGMGELQLLGLMLVGAVTVMFIILVAAGLTGFPITLGVVQLGLVIGIVVAFLLPWMVITRLADRRRRRMEQQFPIALDIFVRGLRSGHPIPAALQLLTVEMEDPIGTEFGIVTDEIAFGLDLREALARMAERWGLPDMHMFVVSVSVQMETGGNLAEILENLSKVIRDRASMFMKVRALSSEGRMTAVILTALPILAFVGLFLTNPVFYLDVATDPIFFIGFGGLILLYLVGFFTIRRMIDLKV